MNARQHLIAERRALRELCHGLGPAEWETPSLCEGWRVRDVVAHVVGVERDLGHLWRARGDVEAANQLSVEQRREIPVLQLLAELDEITPVHGLARLFASLFLVDNWIHQEDIRRPLGRLRRHHPDRLRWILRVVAHGAVSPRARGVRFVATDVDLAIGRGPEVRGPAADLIMAAAGRESEARDLDGAGLPQLLGHQTGY